MGIDLLVVGGGPAGCSAALFAARTKRKVVMIHKGMSTLVFSLQWLLPGFPEEFGPVDWLKNLHEQIQKEGVELIEEEVVQASLGASEKKITMTSGKTLETNVVILASGCHHRRGLIEGEEKFSGHGVFYNAYQDGFWFQGKTIVAEGKSEATIREVLYLSHFANKIYFIVPAMRLEGDEKLLSVVKQNEKIEILLSASLKKIVGDEKISSVIVLSSGEEKEFGVDGVFLYGRQSTPQYEFLKGTVEISPEGCVLVDDQLMTSIPGVFACGDMLAAATQMPMVSAAQGLIAAMNADRYLSNLNL